MNLLLGIVSLVAVFTVNGQIFLKEATTGDTGNEADDKDLRIQDGQPIGDNSFEESQNILDETELQYFDEQDNKIQKKKGSHVRKLRRSRCKARNSCVVMGGLCVTNATLCSGRLVPEGCKGTNCQCCVPGNFEAKFNHLEEELQSFKEYLNSELQSFEANISNSNSDLNTGVNSLRNSVINSSADVNSELQSLKNNMNNMNSNLNSKLYSMNSNITSKLDTLAHTQRCSTPWKSIGGRCYLFSVDVGENLRDWDDARSFCQLVQGDLGTAGHGSPDPLLSYINSHYDDSNHVTGRFWQGASKSGSSWKWTDGRSFSSSDNLWKIGNPSGDGNCVDSFNYGSRTYLNDERCSYSARFVCEK